MEVNPCDHRRQPGPLPCLHAGVLEHQKGGHDGHQQHRRAPRRARVPESAPVARGPMHQARGAWVTCTHRLSQHHSTDRDSNGRGALSERRARASRPCVRAARTWRRTRRARRRAGTLAPCRGSPPRPGSRGWRLRPAGQASRAPRWLPPPKSLTPGRRVFKAGVPSGAGQGSRRVCVKGARGTGGKFHGKFEAAKGPSHTKQNSGFPQNSATFPWDPLFF